MGISSRLEALRGDTRVVRARARVASAVAVAHGGRYATAERMLRDALGILERRDQYAGAARAAATLSQLLRERGRTSTASVVWCRAQRLFAAAADLRKGQDADAPEAAEQEDYVEARTLLTRGERASRWQPQSVLGVEPRVAAEALLIAFAGDVVTLFRLSEAVDDVGPLSPICVWLRQRLRARSVGVYRLGHGQRRLAGAGAVEPVPASVVREVSAGKYVRCTQFPGGRGVAVPVTDNDQTVGALVGRWSRVLPSTHSSEIERLLQVASVVCEPEVRLQLCREGHSGPAHPTGLLGDSLLMVELRESISRAAAAPYSVVIEGETGVGKELVAQALHRESPRRPRPFCAVNCATLNDDLFEAELFGHARGAFTGAIADRTGLFEEAHRGTLFLDEVAELSPRAQAKLLRVLQEGELRRVGENTRRPVDVHVVAATNRSLSGEVAAGRFRADLRFRLSVIELQVPPLRERREDIRLLVLYFWERALAQTGGRAKLTGETLDALTRYDWPGNVRKLQNVVAGLSVRAPRRGMVGARSLPLDIRGGCGCRPPTLEEARRDFDRQFVHGAMGRANGRSSVAAEELGITRQGLAKLRARLGL